MAIEYRLIPPFLHVPEESDFADAWERFCCKLLNLEHGTSDIFVRSPPEQGVDLFDPTRKVAYQCKSVESGKAGDFNPAHAIGSFRAALANQAAIGWVRYALCTNVDVTGTALSRLREAVPDLILLPASHWTQLCEKHPAAVERNFRLVIDVQPRRVSYGQGLEDVSGIFGDPPATPNADCYVVLLYSNRHDTLYRLPVRAGMSVGELVEALCRLFRLPDRANFEQDGISVSLSHSLVVDGRRVPFAKSLAEAGIAAGSVVTYWTQIQWSDRNERREFGGHVMNLQTLASLDAPRSRRERKDSALAAYRAMLARRFDQLDSELLDDGGEAGDGARGSVKNS